MDIVLKGTEKDINALLKKERLWLVRHNVNSLNKSDEDSININDSFKDLESELTEVKEELEELNIKLGELNDIKTELETTLSKETLDKEQFKTAFDSKKMEVMTLQKKIKKLESSQLNTK